MNHAREREREEQSFPWVSATIIAVCLVVFALSTYIEARWPPKTEADQLAVMLKLGALSKPAVRNHEWWRLVAYAFQHSGYLHLFVSLLSVLGVGVPLERRVGGARFLQVALITCVGGAAFAILFPRVLTVGASGMVFGWAGALLPLLASAQARRLGVMLVLAAIVSLFPMVSWQAHLGGFLFGLVCGLQLRRDPETFSTRAPILVAFAASLALWGAYRS